MHSTTVQLDWQDSGRYDGSQHVTIGDYRITETALGVFVVELIGRNSGAVQATRIAYDLPTALQLAGVDATKACDSTECSNVSPVRARSCSCGNVF